MSLRVWLPLNGTLDNQGLEDVTITSNGTFSYTNGKLKQGLLCNGSSFLEIEGVALNKEASIAYWSKTSINKKMAWLIVATSSDKLNLYENGLYSLNTGDGTNNPFQDSLGNTINVLHDDRWHHFAIIFNSNETKLYIDGLYKGNVKTFKDPTTTNEKIVRIGGGYNNTHTYDWNGMLNDFRIYDHALSSMEVKQISQGLVLHYPLNNIGIKEDIEYDCSGYCNNGIRIGNF